MTIYPVKVIAALAAYYAIYGHDKKITPESSPFSHQIKSLSVKIYSRFSKVKWQMLSID